MSENHPATSDTPELHSFVKLAIAYLGIMAGFAILGLTFYVVAARGEASGGALEPASVYYANVSSYIILFVLSLLAPGLLIKRKLAGAYVAFAALVLSIFAPSLLLTGQSAYGVIWWFAIPNSVVGILLLKSIKTLD